MDVIRYLVIRYMVIRYLLFVLVLHSEFGGIDPSFEGVGGYFSYGLAAVYFSFPVAGSGLDELPCSIVGDIDYVYYSVKAFVDVFYHDHHASGCAAYLSAGVGG